MQERPEQPGNCKGKRWYLLSISQVPGEIHCSAPRGLPREQPDHLLQNVFKLPGSFGWHEKSSRAAHPLTHLKAPHKGVQHLRLIFPTELTTGNVSLFPGDPPLCTGHLREKSPGIHRTHKNDKKQEREPKGSEKGRSSTPVRSLGIQNCTIHPLHKSPTEIQPQKYTYLIKEVRIRVTTALGLTLDCAVSSAPLW